MTGSDRMVEVRLLEIPLAVWDAVSEHHEALFREFQLIAAGPSEPSSVPARLIALVDKATQRYSSFTSGRTEQIEAARRAGLAELDVVFELPLSAVEVAAELGDLLDRAEEFCRSGALLTLVADDTVRRFREWYLEELGRQALGEEPTSYPAWLERQGAT